MRNHMGHRRLACKLPSQLLLYESSRFLYHAVNYYVFLARGWILHICLCQLTQGSVLSSLAGATHFECEPPLHAILLADAKTGIKEGQGEASLACLLVAPNFEIQRLKAKRGSRKQLPVQFRTPPPSLKTCQFGSQLQLFGSGVENANPWDLLQLCTRYVPETLRIQTDFHCRLHCVSFVQSPLFPLFVVLG